MLARWILAWIFVVLLPTATLAAPSAPRTFTAAQVIAGHEYACYDPGSDGRNSGGDWVYSAQSVASLQGVYLPAFDPAPCFTAFTSYSGAAAATADLSAGELKISAAIQGVGPGRGVQAVADAYAEFREILTFLPLQQPHIIPIDVTVTGTVHTGLGPDFPRVELGVSTDPAFPPGSPCCHTLIPLGSGPDPHAVSFTYSTAAGVTPEAPDVVLWIRFEGHAFGPDSAADFSNTLHVSLRLPPGITFTSASGVFLTATDGAAVPEPSTMLLVGLGLPWIVGRRRPLR
jgi:PEP-CTERM motif-containing protein